jgi:hypothetical protein
MSDLDRLTAQAWAAEKQRRESVRTEVERLAAARRQEMAGEMREAMILAFGQDVINELEPAFALDGGYESVAFTYAGIPCHLRHIAQIDEHPIDGPIEWALIRDDLPGHWQDFTEADGGKGITPRHWLLAKLGEWREQGEQEAAREDRIANHQASYHERQQGRGLTAIFAATTEAMVLSRLLPYQRKRVDVAASIERCHELIGEAITAAYPYITVAWRTPEHFTSDPYLTAGCFDKDGKEDEAMWSALVSIYDSVYGEGKWVVYRAPDDEPASGPDILPTNPSDPYWLRSGRHG